MDENRNIDINYTEGVERFKDQMLFLAGECQKVFGVDWQKRQMVLFPNTELVTIPNAGHEMFAENPEASVAVVRAYLSTQAQ